MESYFKDFNLQDCATILKKKLNTLDFTVTSFKFHPLSDKLAFLGEHSYLEIFYEENGENKWQRFFGKAMANFERTQEVFLIENGGFLKECLFYKEFIPDLLNNSIDIINDSIAKCYFVSDMKFLIFEDLSILDYKVIDPKVHLNFECVKIGLEALAKMHCSGFIFEEKMAKETGEPFRVDEEYPEVFKESFFPCTKAVSDFVNGAKVGTKAIISLLDEEPNLAKFEALTEEAFDNFYEIVKPSKKFRNTICHADTWAANIMFKFENDTPIHCYFVDFQMQRYSPPAQDVMCFIYMTTHQGLRRKHLKYLVNYYYEKCADILNEYNLAIDNILPYEEYIESCDYYKVFANCMAINHHFQAFVPPECAKYLFDNAYEIVFVSRAENVLKFCEKSELYRKKCIENISDLKEIFIEQGKL